jgi:hypothetical protein
VAEQGAVANSAYRARVIERALDPRRRLVVGAGATALVFAIAACDAPTGSPTATPPSSQVAVSASPTSTPFPTPTASPRAPRALTPVAPVRESDVVLRVAPYFDTPYPAPPSVMVMADGRIITPRGAGMFVERRLTPTGVKRIRDEVLGTGLFARDQNVGLTPVPGPTPPGRGGAGFVFTIWNGARTVTVSVATLQRGEEPYYAPSATRDTLVRLAERLGQSETWLPASAWSEATAQWYAPAAFRVYVASMPVSPLDPRTYSDVDLVDWPFTTALRDLGEEYSAGAHVGLGRCVTLTSDDVTLLRGEFDRIRAVMPRAGYPDGAWKAEVRSTSLGLAFDVVAEPLWPEEFSCAGGFFR